MTRSARSVLLAAVILAGVGAAAAQPYPPAGADWPTYAGTIDGRRYSALDQVNTTNVSKLRPVWMFQTGTANNSSSFECTPLVVDGTMYVTSPDDVVTALDAATGELKWEYKPTLLISPDALKQKLCCGHVNRGVAFHHGKNGDRIYIGMLDARLAALDAATGKLVPTFGDKGIVTIIDFKDGYSETAAPVVWNDRIYIGVAGSEFKTRGFISAYDAETGNMIWRWHTIPKPGEAGGDSWPLGYYKKGGVGVWMNSTIDEKNRQVIFATGNPNPDFDGSKRPGDNLFSCSVVALDADTGTYRWHFQEVRHDLWDYDQSAAPILFTTNITGKPVDAVGAAGKTGWFYMLDRLTGKSIVPLKEVKVANDASPNGLAASKVQFVPDDGPPYHIQPFVVQKNMWVAPHVIGEGNAAPGLSGGSEWSPLSTSPRTNYIYIASIEKEMFFCKDILTGAAKKKSSISDDQGKFTTQMTCAALAILVDLLGMSLGGVAIVPSDSNPHGAFIAIDANTGNVVPGWRYETVPHPIGGTIATAGDVVFAGESNGWFNALDARSGKRLWRFNCGAGVNAAPMTYALKDAAGKWRQYVAVAAGGIAGASLPNARPDDPNGFKNFRNGDTVVVFALPED
jgi:PQQ-dependent dehydrogenase (methanol/ethanol family)